MQNERIASHSITIDREVQKVHILLSFISCQECTQPPKHKHFINNRHRRHLLQRCLWRWLFLKNKITVHHHVQYKCLHHVYVHNTILVNKNNAIWNITKVSLTAWICYVTIVGGGGHKKLLNLMEKVHFITPHSTAAVMGALLHRKLASTWDSEPVFLLQFNLPYFIKYSQIALRS